MSASGRNSEHCRANAFGNPNGLSSYRLCGKEEDGSVAIFKAVELTRLFGEHDAGWGLPDLLRSQGRLISG